MSPAAGVLPVVRMCGNPYCGGFRACGDVRTDRRTMAAAEWLTASSEQAVTLLRRELAISAASDSTGMRHMVPAGAEFTVHKGMCGMSEADLALLADAGHASGEGEYYVAVYSGPDLDLDDILAGSPPWSPDLVSERLAALHQQAA